MMADYVPIILTVSIAVLTIVFVTIGVWLVLILKDVVFAVIFFSFLVLVVAFLENRSGFLYYL